MRKFVPGKMAKSLPPSFIAFSKSPARNSAAMAASNGSALGYRTGGAGDFFGAGGWAVTGSVFPGTPSVPGAVGCGTLAGPLPVTGVRPVKIRKKIALSPTMPRKTRIGVLLEPRDVAATVACGGASDGRSDHTGLADVDG